MKRTLPALMSLALAIGACETTRPPTGASSTAPKASASAPPVAATVVASGSAQTPTAVAPRTTGMFDHVYIYDIDWRTGGHALFLRGDGSGISRTAGALKDNLQNEKRFTLPPSGVPNIGKGAISILLGMRGPVYSRDTVCGHSRHVFA